uniref:Uncharacterized protein n=1 Tax=Rhizophora mucronata TaxID=61149 RepID=A0A2P2N9B8_RHIMU
MANCPVTLNMEKEIKF